MNQIVSGKNWMIKTLEDANVKLSSVFGNVSGAIASKIIQDIIDGKEEVEGLMQHIHGTEYASLISHTSSLGRELHQS